MTAFFSRRGAGAGGRKPTVPIRVGQVYLDVRRRMLYCLNETARQLLDEGVPLRGDNVVPNAFRTLEGEAVQVADLPVMRAWRERTPQENSYLFAGPDGVSRHLTWNASPLADRDAVRGILSSLVVVPFEPDWQHLAGLAHDLRTPLQALRLLMPLLDNTALPSESRSILERIRACVDRTLAISLALLEWARGPTRGGRSPERQWFALEPFLDALAGEQAVQAQDKAIGWRTAFNAARGLEIHANRMNLGRLMSNLMNNAIRYTPRGEVTIRAGWRAAATLAPPLFVLSVEDTGTGISPEDKESIFQPFERGRSGRESDSDGSGLGLSVVDRLVEELGLTLELFSEYG
ncbi:MAG: sensor histidine kinase, partial [Gemmataceae bacterium]